MSTEDMDIEMDIDMGLTGEDLIIPEIETTRDVSVLVCLELDGFEMSC